MEELKMMKDPLKLMEVEAINVASVSISIQIIMLVITFMIGHLLRRNKIMVIHEAGAALLLGVLVGLIVRLTGEEKGFNNFGAICVFSFLGTFISTIGVGTLIYMFGQLHWTYSMPFLVCLTFGALISATDPVTVLAIFHELGADANLYAYVFGESVLNDAVAIVMYKTVLSFITKPISERGIFEALSFFIVIFVGSFSIGVLAGMLSALLFKYGGFQQKGLSILESCLLILFPYLAYNIADALELSGIVSILFAGITMKYYTAPNLSSQAQQITTGFFGMLAKLSETFVFIYMGVSTFLEEQSWSRIGFAFFTIISILIARSLNVYPCAIIVNRFRERPKRIPKNHQHALCFSGLRGAMAFALALQSVSDLPDNHGRVLLTSTLLTIFFTVLFIGGSTSYVLKVLQVECHGPEHEEEQVEEESSEGSSENVSDVEGSKPEKTPGLEILSNQKEKLKKKLKKLKSDTSFTNLDKKYLKPFFQASQPTSASGASNLVDPTHAGSIEIAHLFEVEEDEEMDMEEFSESRGFLASSRITKNFNPPRKE